MFGFTASDQDLADAAGPFIYHIQWGDGSSTTVSGGASVFVLKTYNRVSADNGVFKITATVTDSRGATSAVALSDFSVLGWTVMVDPLAASRCILVVVGSQGDDQIKIKDYQKDDDLLRVKIRDREEDVRYRGLVSADVDRILVFGLRGADDITIDKDITVQTMLWGGEGDDRIKGGGGNDVILGEKGDDKIDGGDGRDILIGGTGSDKIHGDDGDDIFVSGYTVYDKHREALEAIMSEWGTTRDFASRRKNIMGTANPTFAARKNGVYFFRFSASNSVDAANDTVFDDGVKDELWGDRGCDWYLYNSDGDHNSIKDQINGKLENGEIADDIDRWW